MTCLTGTLALRSASPSLFSSSKPSGLGGWEKAWRTGVALARCGVSGLPIPAEEQGMGQEYL